MFSRYYNCKTNPIVPEVNDESETSSLCLSPPRLHRGHEVDEQGWWLEQHSKQPAQKILFSSPILVDHDKDFIILNDEHQQSCGSSSSLFTTPDSLCSPRRSLRCFFASRPQTPEEKSSLLYHDSSIITNATSDSDDFARFSPLPVATKPAFTIRETFTGQHQEEESVTPTAGDCHSKATRRIPSRAAELVFDGLPFFPVSPSRIELVFDGRPFFPVSPPTNKEDRDNKQILSQGQRNKERDKVSLLHDVDDRIQMCHLLQPSDRKLTTEFTLAIMDQVDIVFLGEEDRNLSRGRKLHPLLLPGLACCHCKPSAGHCGRYFPSTLKTMSDPKKTLLAIYNHLSRCKHCPKNLKLKMHNLQQIHDDQSIVLAQGRQRCGSKRFFYERVWALLKDTADRSIKL